jgi:hypothetical protein
MKLYYIEVNYIEVIFLKMLNYMGSYIIIKLMFNYMGSYIMFQNVMSLHVHRGRHPGIIGDLAPIPVIDDQLGDSDQIGHSSRLELAARAPKVGQKLVGIPEISNLI